MGQAGGGAYETLDDRLLLVLVLMPLLLAVEDAVARDETLGDELEDQLVEALDDPDEVLAPGAEELKDPDEMLAPGTEGLEALVLGICDADE